MISSAAKKATFYEIIIFVITGVLFFSTFCPGELITDKTQLGPGLYLWKFRQLEGSRSNISVIVLQADQRLYNLQLISAKKEGQVFSLGQWTIKYNLIAAINASMFWQDQKTSTGYMRDFDFINNRRIHPGYGGFLVFHPKLPQYQSIKIIDKITDNNWQKELARYQSIVQNFRLITHGQASFWKKNQERFSIAAIALDRQTNILFILSVLPTTVNQFITSLLDLPIAIDSCLFAEGGTRAGLYLRVAGMEQGWYGRVNNQILDDVQRILPTAIPNIIGLVKRSDH